MKSYIKKRFIKYWIKYCEEKHEYYSDKSKKCHDTKKQNTSYHHLMFARAIFWKYAKDYFG